MSRHYYNHSGAPLKYLFYEGFLLNLYLQLCYLPFSEFELRLEVLDDAGAPWQPGGLVQISPTHWHRHGCQGVVQRVLLWVDKNEHRISHVTPVQVCNTKYLYFQISICLFPGMYLGEDGGVQTSIVCPADGARAGQRGCGGGRGFSNRVSHGLPLLGGKDEIILD